MLQLTLLKIHIAFHFLNLTLTLSSFLFISFDICYEPTLQFKMHYISTRSVSSASTIPLLAKVWTNADSVVQQVPFICTWFLSEMYSLYLHEIHKRIYTLDWHLLFGLHNESKEYSNNHVRTILNPNHQLYSSRVLSYHFSRIEGKESHIAKMRF